MLCFLVWLPDNQLIGKIPTEVGLMTSLTHLYLYNNQLEGELPREIMNCDLIQELYIFNNRMTGSLPDIFDSFYNMVWFSAYNNAFSGQIPDSIWNMSFSLEFLQLQNNDLTGTVPDSFCLNFNTTDSNYSSLSVDNLNWFSDSPKVECGCCAESCRLWDPVINIKAGPIDCPEENIVNFWVEYNVNPSMVTDDQTKEVLYPSEGFCMSPTGCYLVTALDLEDDIVKTLYLGYSNATQSVIERDISNPICDGIDICGKIVDSNHPIRPIINYLTQIGLFDIDLILDPTSYQHKALCSIIDDDYDFEFFDDLSYCDGTMLQFFAIHLFLNSLNYFDEDTFILTTNEMCNITGAYCNNVTQYAEKIDLHDKNLTGHISSEIRLLVRLEKIRLSENKINGKIDESIFDGYLPNLEVINIGNNSLEGDTEVIQAMLKRPLLKEFNISNNLFFGSLPSVYPYTSLGE